MQISSKRAQKGEKRLTNIQKQRDGPIAASDVVVEIDGCVGVPAMRRYLRTVAQHLLCRRRLIVIIIIIVEYFVH